MSTGRNAALSPADLRPADARGLSDFVASEGLLDRRAVERALRASASSGERFDQVLTKLGLLSEADLAACLSRYLGVPLHVPSEEGLGPILPDRIPESFIRENRVLPVRLEDNTLTLAVVDPFDRMPIESLRFVVDQAIVYEVATPAQFEKAIAGLFGEGPRGPGDSVATAAETPSEIDLQRLRDSASEAPVIRLVNQIVADAVDAHASDIHVEPTATSLLVRYRVDGVLRTVEEVPGALRAAVISRIKIMAKLDIAERRLPQDGRIKLAFRGHEIDFRTATIPTLMGESVVMRVLDRNRVQLDYASLGFDEGQIATLEVLTRQPNGIILVTGPTGSGKTTTLYTMLKRLNEPTVKIFTVEDPIEYQLGGINQVQVQPSIGLDFPTSLRAILRQDPDMIMIGEIRDQETARIAVQASLTGHLVLSTLHTNSAAETVTRLTDMGIEHFLLGSTVPRVMAQRLLRRLCAHCARPHERASAWRQYVAEHCPDALDDAILLEPVGCGKCKGTGFRGRLSIAELLVVTGEIQEAILTRRAGPEIETLARSRGVASMFEDGLRKACRGLTTIEEVLRVASGP